MKLLAKTLIITGITVITMIAVIYAASSNILLENALNNEKNSVEESIERSANAIEQMIMDLDLQAEDYSVWDDTYYYVLNGNNDYTEVNYVDEVFPRLNIDMVMIFDKSGSILFEKAFDRWNNVQMEFPMSIKDQILNHVGLFLRHSGTKGSLNGLLVSSDAIAAISSQPILTSLGEGPSPGTLLMGRLLGEKEIEKLSQGFKMTLSIQKTYDAKLPLEFSQVRDALLTGIESFIKPLDSETISGFRFIKDIYGENSLILRVDLPRNYFKQMRSSISTFVLFLVISAIIMGFMILIMLEKLVLFPVKSLCSSINLIGKSPDFSGRLPVKKGNDELTELYLSINGMLDELQTMHRKTEESELRFKLLSEQNILGMAVVQNGYVKYANQAMADILECTVEEMLYWKPDTFSTKLNFKNNCLKEIVTLYSHEIHAKNNKLKLVELYCRVISYEGENADFIVISDITEKVRKEQEIKYLNVHDKLTGVYNRTYFEDRLKHLDTPANHPISLIIGDINGLKLTNDIFGRDEGDKLLKNVAAILENRCGNDSIVARWGGDEFAAILPKTSGDKAFHICEAIIRECSETESNPIRPSVSLGCATKEKAWEDMQEILREAEERMYRHKLLETRSTRNSIVSSLGKTLFEKSYETEEHAKRMLEISTKIGKELGLSGYELDELNLLSILHDIGKIAINESILAKPGKLTEDEREEIRKHAEIGFRIAESSRELSHISKYILFHHERWDGTGYPQGLKGNAIPKLSRIISIVDAYDVMTHARPYKEAVSHQEAIKEIKRCAGKQFDPKIVEIFIKVMADEK